VSKESIDKKVSAHLKEAERVVLDALRDCGQHEKSVVERLEKLRTRKVARDLKRILASIMDVRKVNRSFVDLSEESIPKPIPKSGLKPTSKVDSASILKSPSKT